MKIKTIAVIGLILAALFQLVPDAAKRVCFVDEIYSVEAATNLLTRGEYTAHLHHPDWGGLGPDATGINRWNIYRFRAFASPGYSIGFLANWMSGLGWIIGGNIFSARLGSSVNIFILLFVLAWTLKHTNWFRTLSESMLFVLIGFVLSILIVPYQIEGINHSQAEVAGAILTLIGCALIRVRFRLAVLVFGFAVIHAKIFYLPVSAVFILYGLRASNRSWREALAQLPLVIVLFFTPFVLWCVWILAIKDLNSLTEFLKGYVAYFTYGSSVLDYYVPKGLWNRLTSPKVEWVHYLFKNKVRILFLFFIPPLAMATWTYLDYKRTNARGVADFARSSTDWILKLGVACLSILTCYWYFFIHDFMWIRHVQPFLLMGFIALYVLFYIEVWPRVGKYKNNTLSVLVVFLFSWQLIKIFPTTWATDPSLFGYECQAPGSHLIGPYRIYQCRCFQE